MIVEQECKVIGSQGLMTTTVTVDVVATTVEELIHKMTEAMESRNVPPGECEGLHGDFVRGNYWLNGIYWRYVKRFGPLFALYHPDAVILPAVVLDPKAVLYGKVL